MKKDTVRKILRANKLKPHRVGTFSQSLGPDFAAKVIDVVGLCLDPPKNAIALCVDEKTQVQALDRTQPMLPMRPDQIERHTHDHKRNGTVQLFAALEVHAGRVIPRIEDRHRSRAFIAFMNQLLPAIPRERSTSSSTMSSPTARRKCKNGRPSQRTGKSSSIPSRPTRRG